MKWIAPLRARLVVFCDMDADDRLQEIRRMVIDADHVSMEFMVRRFALNEAIPVDAVLRLQQRLADAHALCDWFLQVEKEA
jgi:hypothetical protein